MNNTSNHLANERRGKRLVEDIKPIPTKDRSNLGKVTLTLDENTQVTAVGVVYGVEHHIEGDDFSATLFLDHYNQRIKVTDYEASDIDELVLRVRFLAEANGFDKIICMASRRDWQKFLRHGYVLEAVLKYFLKGEDAYIVSKFRSQERLTSHNLMEEILLIEDIMTASEQSAPKRQPSGPTEYQFRMAREDDIPGLVELYGDIFETYPSPLIHADYLEAVFHKETLFAVATEQGKVVAAASAELYPSQRAAELTDCATHPVARGKGLMSGLLTMLEQKLVEREYICAYTMARARSFGMNHVFHQLGYEFLGRLVNNCDIYGAYEDMNLWVRHLGLSPPKGQKPTDN